MFFPPSNYSQTVFVLLRFNFPLWHLGRVALLSKLHGKLVLEPSVGRRVFPADAKT